MRDKDTFAASGVIDPKTAAWHRSSLAPLVAALGHRPAAELAAYEVTAVRFRPHTMQSVRAMYHWAVRQRLVQANPFVGVPQPKYSPRTRTPTELESRLIRRAIAPRYRWLLWFLRRTGARPGELRNATWDDYDANAASIRLTEFKAKKRRKDGCQVRFLYLDENANRVLSWIYAKRQPAKDHYIFPGSGSKPIRKDALCLAFRRVVKRLKLNQVHRERLVPYSHRHGFATAAVAKGVPLPHLSEVLGHTTITMTTRYLHPSREDLRKAVQTANTRTQYDGRPKLRLVS